MTLWIMVGISGSGKTYYAKHMIEGLGWKHISRDSIRFQLVKEGEDYFSHEKEVYKEFIRQIKLAMDEDGIMNIIIDATHLDWNSRRKLLTALGLEKNKGNIKVIPVVINTDVLTAIKHNEERTGRAKVSRNVINRMNASFTDPKTDPYKYTAIMYVDNTNHNIIDKPVNKFMYKITDIPMREYSVKEILEREA